MTIGRLSSGQVKVTLSMMVAQKQNETQLFQNRFKWENITKHSCNVSGLMKQFESVVIYFVFIDL